MNWICCLLVDHVISHLKNEFKSDTLCLRTSGRMERCIEIVSLSANVLVGSKASSSHAVLPAKPNSMKLNCVAMLRLTHKQKNYSHRDEHEKGESSEREREKIKKQIQRFLICKARSIVIVRHRAKRLACGGSSMRLSWHHARKNRTLRQVIEFYGKLILLYFSFRFGKLLN